MNRNHLRIFPGSDGLKNFLTAYEPTPLVELPPSLNPFIEKGVIIYAKLTYMTPIVNSKLFAVLGMLESLSKQAQAISLKGKNIVEASSGNTGLALAILAPLYGVARVILVVPQSIVPSKKRAILLAGAEVIYATDGETPSDTARRLGKQPGWINLGQYDNPANPDIFERVLGPEIAEQMKEMGEEIPTILVSGLGTTGTLTGTGRYFRKQERPDQTKTWILGVKCTKDTGVPGVRNDKQLEEVTIPYLEVIDHSRAVSLEDAQEAMKQLFKHGIIGGPSSGLAFQGLLNELDMFVQKGTLDAHRGRDGKIRAVVIFQDTTLPYIPELPDKLFG